MPTIITGEAATAATLGITAERRKIERRDRIFLLEPNKNPLILLLKRISKEVTGNPKYDWLESEATPVIDQINNGAGYASGATSMVVDNGPYFFVNALVQVQRTSEIMRVTAVATNTLTVSRSWGATAAAALVDNDYLTILGNAVAEGANAPTSRMVKKVNNYNYCQIFRQSFGATRTLQKSSLYGPNYLKQEGKERGIEHAKYMEMAFWFGERGIDVSGDEPLRSTGGVVEFVVTNAQDFSGTLTEALMDTAAESAFRYGESDVRFLFCGRAANSAVSQLAVGKVRLVPRDKIYGLAVTRYIATHGEWNIIPHRLWEGGENADLGVSVDMANLKYRYLKDSDTSLHMNIQANDLDGIKHEFLSECGLERRQEKTFMLLTDMD